MKHDIKLVAADFDGTLLSPDGSISPYNKEMIYKAQEAGIIFAAATGRYPENTAQIMEDEGIVCPIIASNGAVVDLSPFGERIHENLMDPASAHAVFEVLESFGEGYYIFGRRTVINRWQIPRHISERDTGHLARLKRRVALPLSAGKVQTTKNRHEAVICCFRSMVPRRGLEPPRSYPLVPETSASTNSATWASIEAAIVATFFRVLQACPNFFIGLVQQVLTLVFSRNTA